MTHTPPLSTTREGLTWAKTFRFLSLFFNACRTRTLIRVKNFEEVPIDMLRAKGIEGILLDADGTLGTHHTREFNASVINHIRAMLERGFKVAIYTNADDDRFQRFKEIGVKVVTDVPAKPDPIGFQIAMTDFLELKDPEKVCMVGDNYVTDGGAVDAGMHFIHVRPIKGSEPCFHSATRFLAYLCSRIYYR